MLQNTAGPLKPEALEANRNGRLTEEQQHNFDALARSGRGSNLALAVGCVIVGVLLLRQTGGGANAWLRPYEAVAAFGVALLLLARAAGIGSRLVRDARRGRVQSVEGAISKRGSGAGYRSPGFRSYILSVGGRTFRVHSGTYAAAPDAGIVRLYYLPRTRVVVNLERLPDRPLPAGALDSSGDVLRTLATAVRSMNVETSAEARATLAAMASRLGRDGQAPPPPPGARDSRPLAEAIIGDWRTGPVSMRFASDGTVAVQLPGGSERRGRWSVDGAGRLHTDATGEDIAGEAWILGDALTISGDGRAFTFRRS